MLSLVCSDVVLHLALHAQPVWAPSSGLWLSVTLPHHCVDSVSSGTLSSYKEVLLCEFVYCCWRLEHKQGQTQTWGWVRSCTLSSLSPMLLSRSGDVLSATCWATCKHLKVIKIECERRRKREGKKVCCLPWRQFSHVEPLPALMTPNFTVNKLNNDAFESCSVYEACYKRSSNGLLICPSTCECPQLVSQLSHCSSHSAKTLSISKAVESKSQIYYHLQK